MSRDVAVLGVGMHPWGKWGRRFTRHGVAAARAALADAGTGLDWRDVGLVAGADTVRGGYPGNVAGAAFARALGWQGARVAGVYAACASGAQALDTVRAHILAGLVDTALVVGADAAPKGFFAPVGGEEARRPGLVALPRAGATNPAHFGLYARRRMALHGDTPEDFARVKVKNAAAGAANPLARQTGRRSPPPRWRPPRSSPTRCDYWTSAPPPTGAPSSSCPAWTSPGAPRRRTRCGSARSPPSPRSTRARCPTSRTSPPTPPSPPRPLSPPPDSGRPSSAPRTRRPASVPRAWTWRRCTTCRRRWSWTGTRTWACARRAGRKLLRDGATALGGRIPVAPSGGLSSFGEAVPAQALAQVCEPTWQVARPVGAPAGRGARVGVTANQGLFGHGSSVVVIR